MAIEAVSKIVTMENLSDVEVEDIDDEPFEFDGSPYLFKPEYTDEELFTLENERTEIEAQRAEQAEAASRPGGALVDVVSKWIQKRKAYAVRSGTSDSLMCPKIAHSVSRARRTFLISFIQPSS